MEITLADVLTLQGAVTAAALVTGFVEVLKRIPALSVIGARGWEQAIALAGSLILVILAFYDARVWTLDAAFWAYVCWLAIAKLATGIHDEVTRAPGAFTAST